ncbi:MAG TPA: hypothetical protein VKI19_03525, partial [Acidimicrobiales bacterium]|nr:hypothetical protein [Acidimicrobiales bacterium]
KMTITVGGSSQKIPTSQSGVPVNYISGLQTLIPVPPNSTFVPGSIVAGNWSFTPAGGSAKTGALTVTECTGAGTGCTATGPNGATFLGPGTSTPYLEATTGTTQFTAGGTLTLPSWSFDVTAASSGSIQTTVSEFDTSANITLGTTSLSIAVATYPAAVESGCLATPAVCATQPTYKFQPIATTTIGSSGGGTTTTTASGATTTTTPGATTTTVAGSSGGTTTTTAAGATVAAGGSTTPTTAARAGGLANTGPPKELWLLGLLGLVLLDLGYLSVSATWRSRRARN